MPVVKLKPVVDASVIVPCATDSVREFEPLPAVPPLKLMALPLIVEKTSDRFWSSVPEGGATIAARWRGHRENRSRGGRTDCHPGPSPKGTRNRTRRTWLWVCRSGH